MDLNKTPSWSTKLTIIGIGIISLIIPIAFSKAYKGLIISNAYMNATPHINAISKDISDNSCIVSTEPGKNNATKKEVGVNSGGSYKTDDSSAFQSQPQASDNILDIDALKPANSSDLSEGPKLENEIRIAIDSSQKYISSNKYDPIIHEKNLLVLKQLYATPHLSPAQNAALKGAIVSVQNFKQLVITFDTDNKANEELKRAKIYLKGTYDISKQRKIKNNLQLLLNSNTSSSVRNMIASSMRELDQFEKQNKKPKERKVKPITSEHKETVNKKAKTVTVQHKDTEPKISKQKDKTDQKVIDQPKDTQSKTPAPEDNNKKNPSQNEAQATNISKESPPIQK